MKLSSIIDEVKLCCLLCEYEYISCSISHLCGEYYLTFNIGGRLFHIYGKEIYSLDSTALIGVCIRTMPYKDTVFLGGERDTITNDFKEYVDEMIFPHSAEVLLKGSKIGIHEIDGIKINRRFIDLILFQEGLYRRWKTERMMLDNYIESCLRSMGG